MARNYNNGSFKVFMGLLRVNYMRAYCHYQSINLSDKAIPINSNNNGIASLVPHSRARPLNLHRIIKLQPPRPSHVFFLRYHHAINWLWR
jgi:hypothetical protein